MVPIAVKMAKSTKRTSENPGKYTTTLIITPVLRRDAGVAAAFRGVKFAEFVRQALRHEIGRVSKEMKASADLTREALG